jgi:hypothetical protein
MEIAVAGRAPTRALTLTMTQALTLARARRSPQQLDGQLRVVTVVM